MAHDQATRDRVRRLYIEGMETLLATPGLEKLVLSDDAARQAVPYLSLDALRQTPQAQAPENQAARPEGPKADPAKAKGGKP